MTPADTDRAPLHQQEVRALAKVYHSAGRARLMLRSAGFPASAIPAGANTMGEFWGQVSWELEGGVMAAGRTRILSKAHAEHPFHPVFAAGDQDQGRPGPAVAGSGAVATPDGRLRVMLLGAEPARYGTTRTGAELRAAAKETRGRLDMRLFPAAGAADLGEIRSILPQVLHLACHGTREELILEDAVGEAHHLAADATATSSTTLVRKSVSRYLRPQTATHRAGRSRRARLVTCARPGREECALDAPGDRAPGEARRPEARHHFGGGSARDTKRHPHQPAHVPVDHSPDSRSRCTRTR